jgi:hypothetical protein
MLPTTIGAPAGPLGADTEVAAAGEPVPLLVLLLLVLLPHAVAPRASTSVAPAAASL